MSVSLLSCSFVLKTFTIETPSLAIYTLSLMIFVRVSIVEESLSFRVASQPSGVFFSCAVVSNVQCPIIEFGIRFVGCTKK